MPMETRQVISLLNDLIQTCKDGEEGFRLSSETTRNSEWKTMFNNYSRQRAQFAAELQAEVRRLGAEPEKDTSISATLHRGWMNVKKAVSDSDSAIMAEAERGEDVAVATYKDALEKDLPSDLRIIVERQYRQVLETHDRVRALERRAA
jgi:uncharacterized protein (TIGR02284 family)